MAASFPHRAERTRAEILDVATVVFARAGFAGSRVEEIAAGTHTTKRMIYYYFGGKEQLYRAVLERALAGLRPRVSITAADNADPLALVRRFTEQTFAQGLAHPDFIRLVITDNLQGTGPLPIPPVQPPGTGPPGPATAPEPPADRLGLEAFQQVLDAGGSTGAVRPGLRAAELVMVINSLCQYRISGRATHRALTGVDLLDPGQVSHQQQFLTTLILAFVSTPAAP